VASPDRTRRAVTVEPEAHCDRGVRLWLWGYSSPHTHLGRALPGSWHHRPIAIAVGLEPTGMAGLGVSVATVIAMTASLPWPAT
jgi:hypothetical protein